MSDLLFYLVEANVALILFFAGYRLWLKNLTFFNINRFYLLFSLIFSSCYPFLDFSGLVFKAPDVTQGIMTVIPNWQPIQFAEKATGWNEYIASFFWICASLLLIRLLAKLSGMIRIHRSSTPVRWSQYTYRATSAITSPFSFWRNIYINPLNHQEVDYEKILKHESVHVSELHSFDILLSEIAILLFWYNPFCWMIKNAVSENLEFLTDKKVLASGIEKQSYQYSLLDICAISGKQSVLANHFNLKNLKKRIMMMNKKETSSKHLGKYLFMVPAIVFASFIFSGSNADVLPINTSIDKYFISEVVEEPMPNDPHDSLKSQLVNVEDISTLQIDDNVLIFFDGKKIKNTQLKNLKQNQIGDIRVYKGDYAKELYGEEGKNGVIVISTTEPAEKIENNEEGIKIRTDNASVDNAVYIVDGKELSKKEFEKLKPEDIKKIEVTKGDHALKQYGERGKGGVIHITTKE